MRADALPGALRRASAWRLNETGKAQGAPVEKFQQKTASGGLSLHSLRKHAGGVSPTIYWLAHGGRRHVRRSVRCASQSLSLSRLVSPSLAVGSRSMNRQPPDGQKKTASSAALMRVPTVATKSARVTNVSAKHGIIVSRSPIRLRQPRPAVPRPCAARKRAQPTLHPGQYGVRSKLMQSRGTAQ